MIGRLEVPRSLEVDRLTQHAPSHAWRGVLDRFDDVLGPVIITITAVLGVPLVDVLSFRSNRCEVSLLNEDSRWSIAWDERFFDYIAIQVMALAAKDQKTIENIVFGTLFRYAGEIQLIDNPHFALLLTKAGYSYYDGELQGFDAKKPMVPRLQIVFRIVRTFILCHELGHIGIRDLEFRRQEVNNLRNALQVYKDVSADKSFVQPYSTEGVRQNVLRMVEEAAIKDEILVDSFALGQVFEVEFALLAKQGSKTDGADAASRIALIYHAIMLLYYCMASMNGVREMMSPKAIVNNSQLSEFRSVSALVSRSDIRGTLWSIISAQHFDFDIRKTTLVTKAIKHPKRDLMARFRATQLPVYNAILGGTDRKGLLSDANDLRKSITEKSAVSAASFLLGYQKN